MQTNTLLHRIEKGIIFKTLSSDFFCHPLYMMAFSMLHRLTPGEQREYQFYRLQHLLRYTRHAIPHWSVHIEKDLTEGIPFDIKKFERLSVLTRETLVQHGADCVVQDLERYRYRTFVTSGSTGIPKKFVAQKVYFQKFVATDEFYANFLGVSFKQFGWMTYKPHLEDLVTSVPVEISSDALQKLLKDKNILAVGGALFRLLLLAELVESGKIQFKPKFVLSGSEFLTLKNRKYLERVFQCPVYNKYACAENGILGLECPERGGFHIDPVNCYMEIVDDDGHPVEDDTQGRVLITTFNNRLMPLIRYDIGDIGGWVDGACTCGLNTPRLFFEGRKLDYIEFSDGKKMSVVGLIRRIDTRFTNIIAKQQIIQESLDKLVLKFVPGPDYQLFHDESLRNFIYQLFRTRSFPEISVEVVRMTSLDNFRNGKHVIFESHIRI